MLAAPAFNVEPEIVTAPFTTEPDPIVDESINNEPVTFEAESAVDENGTGYETGPLEAPESYIAEPVETPATAPVYFETPAMHADEVRRPVVTREDDEGGYYVTVIQESSGPRRNYLLLGASALVLFFIGTVVLIDLFTKDLVLWAVDDNPLFSANLLEEIPMMVAEKTKKTKRGGRR